MSRKGENIFKRKDGRWEARYFKEYDESHKIKYGYVYGSTYSEAKQKRNKVLLDKEYKTTKKNTDLFTVILDKWISNKKDTVKESTLARYIYIINAYIRPKLGNLTITKITDNILLKYTNELKNSNLSNKTIKDIIVLLKQILDNNNINIKINSPKVKKREANTLLQSDQKKLEYSIINDMNNINFGILLTLYTGLRIGELCALKWNDFDFENNILKVSHTMIRIKNIDSSSKKTKIVIEKPKTDNSIRIIPTPSSIISYALKLKSNNANYVLTNSIKYIEPRTMYSKYKSLLRKLDIDKYNFHALRHTFASRCIELGFDPKTLCKILGHSDIKITLSLYVHPSYNLKILSMEKLKLL